MQPLINNQKQKKKIKIAVIGLFQISIMHMIIFHSLLTSSLCCVSVVCNVAGLYLILSPQSCKIWLYLSFGYPISLHHLLICNYIGAHRTSDTYLGHSSQLVNAKIFAPRPPPIFSQLNLSVSHFLFLQPSSKSIYAIHFNLSLCSSSFHTITTLWVTMFPPSYLWFFC